MEKTAASIISQTTTYQTSIATRTSNFTETYYLGRLLQTQLIYDHHNLTYKEEEKLSTESIVMLLFVPRETLNSKKEKSGRLSK
jgi:hypothetical protein